MFVTRKKGAWWEVVEQVGVRERVVETCSSEGAALASMRRRNSKALTGRFGTFQAATEADAKRGCTCSLGMTLEATGCPVHDER